MLENFHVAETFKVLMKEGYNIFETLTPEEYRIVRRRMIENILATDMTNHARYLATLKSKLETFDIRSGKNVDRMIFEDNITKTYENQQSVLNICIHAADISNPAKPLNIYKTWVDMVFVEFFNQGDIEKSSGYQVSLLCDREATNINKAQVGFINFVVLPTFESLLNVSPLISPYMDMIRSNQKAYEELANK